MLFFHLFDFVWHQFSLFSPPKGPCCSDATPPPRTPLPSPTPERESPEQDAGGEDAGGEDDAAKIAKANQNLENLFNALPAGILNTRKPFEAEHDIATSCH